MAMVPAVPGLAPRTDPGGQLRRPLGPRRHRRTIRHPLLRPPRPPLQQPRGSSNRPGPRRFFSSG
jgi:hypothetical protein